MKRAFDIIFSLIGLLFLSPLFLILFLIIPLDSKGGVFFRQYRVGKNGKEFKLIKFRSMKKIAEDKLELTVGEDQRITRIGKYIRSYKIDEFPQLWNILKGEMSFVGPRPEVPRYVQLYSDEQRIVLSVRPGLTDPASLAFMNEAQILAETDNPTEKYIREIMPEKLRMNIDYLEKRSFLTDLRIILKTMTKILT